MLGGEFDLDLEVLLPRFRQLFPNKSRKSLTEEFTKLAQFTHYDNKKQGVRTPLTALEFKASLTKSKPSFQGLFTEEEFHLIFAFFDTEENKKIALFEFVKGIRVRTALFMFHFLVNFNVYIIIYPVSSY
jgi:hypothetical protein